MLVGYVSDERYIALDGVLFEFEIGNSSIEAHSRATGAIYATSSLGVFESRCEKTASLTGEFPLLFCGGGDSSVATTTPLLDTAVPARSIRYDCANSRRTLVSWPCFARCEGFLLDAERGVHANRLRQ